MRSNRLEKMLTCLGIFLKIIVTACKSENVELMMNDFVISIARGKQIQK